jgi:uncharacterized membrane protein YoaK (UPF0700 family)
MSMLLRDAWHTLAPTAEDRHGPLAPMLVALTVVTGLVDAFSYLVLGHVFVANMTGNVVFMAFALARAGGFSLVASLVALLSFWAGALVGGRIGHRYAGHRGRVLLGTSLVEAAVVLAAYVCCLSTSTPSTGAARYVLIVLLGLGMGAQNASARRLAVPDLTTTVLTMTIAGFAADGRLAGGTDSKAGRRLLSAAALFVGALVGALLALHTAKALTLLVAGALLLATVLALTRCARSDRAWTRPV